jgi:alpha-ketoglutarate-dependent taurine dioxygenase
VENGETQRLGIKKLGALKRRPFSLSQKSLIKAENLEPGNPLPLVVEPAVEGLSPITWAEGNREFIETETLKRGGILFRNFSLKSEVEFEQFIRAISGDLLEYTYRSTPRSQVSGNIYTSTEYPADQFIPLHNEMSYSANWPMKIWFFCVKSAQHGGETPIVDSRKVFERIDPKIRQLFMQQGVMYVRNYGGGLDLTWENVFQTTQKSDVEDYCQSTGIDFEWKDNNRLRTRQVCQAVATHPRTGEWVWFNQSHLFHLSSLKQEVRQSLLSSFKEDDLPRNAFYGDGSPIEASVLEEIRGIYEQEAVTFSWRDGDILMLDNMLTAHGRKPYQGSRKVLVGMAEPFSGKESLLARPGTEV